MTPSSLVDTHAHLDDRAFAADREAVIARAVAAGVSRILTVGVDLPSSRAAVALAEKHPAVYAAVGLHPHDARKWHEATARELRALAQHPRVVAIGETGLDFYRNLSPREAQGAAFRAQLALAGEVGLPVIIHDREAHGEVIAILKEWATEVQNRRVKGQSPDRQPRPAARGVLHAFSGDLGMAEEASKLGFCIALGGPLTFAHARRPVEVARQLPLDRLLLETDCPYMTPEPFRGRRNEPAYVRYVAERLAQIRAQPVEVVAKATTQNALTLFPRLQSVSANGS
jgi:TatD DNase family protein